MRFLLDDAADTNTFNGSARLFDSIDLMAKANQAAEDEAESEAVAPAAELVSLEEADEDATDSGAIKVDLGDDDEAIESDDEEDDTFLAEDEDEENDDDVSGIIGDVDADET